MEKLERLQSLLRDDIGSGVVAFSGGCDSTFLLKVAHDVLGERVVALTAVSPSMAPSEREEARQLAEKMGVRHLWVESREMKRDSFVQNPPDRCFHCKDELFSLALGEAARLKLGVVMDGSNRDDRGDHRPGRRAARQHGVRSPLDEVGYTKEEIRRDSRRLGLPTWDKPAIACLASRFPYGTPITENNLQRVLACEESLRQLGFRQFRARFHDPVLRLEIAPDELHRLLEADLRQQVVDCGKEQGFLYVTLDLQGYRSGSLNEALAPSSREEEKPYEPPDEEEKPYEPPDEEESPHKKK